MNDTVVKGIVVVGFGIAYAGLTVASFKLSRHVFDRMYARRFRKVTEAVI